MFYQYNFLSRHFIVQYSSSESERKKKSSERELTIFSVSLPIHRSRSSATRSNAARPLSFSTIRPLLAATAASSDCKYDHYLSIFLNYVFMCFFMCSSTCQNSTKKEKNFYDTEILQFHKKELKPVAFHSSPGRLSSLRQPGCYRRASKRHLQCVC